MLANSRALIASIAVLALPGVLAGCGDKRAANAHNLKAALDAHYADHCIFITPSVGLAAFPVSVDASGETMRYDALVDAGLLTATTGATEHPGVLGIGTVRSTEKTYALTSMGQSLFVDHGAADRGFCAGHYTVTAVDNFTLPTANDGRTVASVDFSVSPDMAAWVSNNSVQARYGTELAQVKPTHDHASVVLTAKGWVVAGDAPPPVGQ